VSRKSNSPNWSLSPDEDDESLVRLMWNSRFRVAPWAVDRTPPPGVRTAWLVLLHVGIVAGSALAWHLDWRGLPLALGMLPTFVYGTWLAIRAHSRVAPLGQFQENYKRYLKAGPYAQDIWGTTEGTQEQRYPKPPGWFVYRTICLFNPWILVSLLGVIAVSVLYLRGDESKALNVGVPALFAGSFLLFLGVLVVGLTGRPVFLLPKLLRDAHGAGRPMSEEELDGPDEPEGDDVLGADGESGELADLPESESERGPEDETPYDRRYGQRRRRRSRGSRT
jgi:hypothetical protein